MPAIEVVPSARRLMNSLRDMGYEFAQAVADIVDNSLAAEASRIVIDVEFSGEDSWVRIADNGTGMSAETLREAMRYGAEREYDEDDLGKFGLGLKTASLSQCRRLSVASRWNPDRAEIHAYAWDLEHIHKVNRWEILPVSREARVPDIFQSIRDHPGTVVLWEHLDRLLDYKHPSGEVARARLAQMCRELEAHLGMVLHRFLAGDAKRRIEIVVNGNEIRAWDPFCRSEQRTEKWEPLHLRIDENGEHGSVRVDPFILPHQSDFSSPSAFRLAAGPNGWNQQQGLYVYRAGRMIQSGGWSRLRGVDEHTKLARVSISFSPNLDNAFKVNVAKMRVQLPGSIRDDLAKLTQKLVKEARRVYDRKEKRTGVNLSSSAEPDSSSHSSGRQKRSKSEGRNDHREDASHFGLPRTLSRSQWSALTLAAAKPGERAIVKAVLNRLPEETQGEK